MNVKVLLFFIGLFGLLTACQRAPLAWDVGVEAPLFKTELTFSNLLSDSMIATNSEQYLSLIIDKELFSLSTDAIAEIPDSLFEFKLDFDENIELNPGDLFFFKSEKQKFKIEPVELNYLQMKHGYLSFQFINPFDQPIEITYKIPAAKKDGISFAETITIPAGNANGKTHVKRIALNDYFLDMRGQNHNESNVFNTTLSVKISDDASGTAHAVTNKLLIKINFEEIRPAYLKGYFGQISTSHGPEQLDFTLLNGIQSGTFDLEKCSGQLTIENGIGADLQVRLSQLQAGNSRTGQAIDFQSPIMNKSLNITRGTESGNTVHPSVSHFDLTNSNLAQMISLLPDRLTYAAALDFNPLGNVSAGNDFVYDGHPIRAKLHLDLPLSFAAHDLVLQKNISYELGEDLERVRSATLHLIADNGFPFSADIALQILNDDDTPLLNIPCTHNSVASGNLVHDGECVPRTSIITLQLDENTTQKLLHNKRLGITVTFNTAGESHVRIYDHYKLNLKMTSDFTYEMEL